MPENATTETATERAPRDEETCSCGRPATVVYQTDDYGDVPYCGIPSAIHASEDDQRPTYPFTVEESERAHLGLMQEATQSVEEATEAAKALTLRLVEDLYWLPELDVEEHMDKFRYAATVLYCLTNVANLDAKHVQWSYATERARKAAQAEEVDA